MGADTTPDGARPRRMSAPALAWGRSRVQWPSVAVERENESLLVCHADDLRRARWCPDGHDATGVLPARRSGWRG